jgi:hypothetical protein
MTVFKLKWPKKIDKSKGKETNESEQIETICPSKFRKRTDRFQEGL